MGICVFCLQTKSLPPIKAAINNCLLQLPNKHNYSKLYQPKVYWLHPTHSNVSVFISIQDEESLRHY